MTLPGSLSWLRSLSRFTAHLGLALALVGASGCGGADGNGSLIGVPCTDSAECGPAGVCITEGRDGLCSMPCQVSGGAGQCPYGSYCDEENVKTDFSAKASMTLCFPACDSDRDCRPGYACKGVSKGPGKVCNPK